jgi:hypothetical protein
MKKTDRVVNQITSGRWLLTIVAAVCLLLFTITDCWAVYHGKEPPISPEAIATIITMVFMSYFRNPKEGADANGDGSVNPPVPPVPPVPPTPPAA